MISKIEELYNSGVEYDQIAILYRAHYHAMELQVELSRRGLPFLITSGLRFSNRPMLRTVAQLRFVANPKDTTAFLRFACLLPKVGRKLQSKLLKIAQKLAQDKSTSVCEVLGEVQVLNKVPKDAKDDWASMSETLLQIHEVASNSSPSVVVEEAIGGWYQLYLRSTYENWPRREEDLESLVDFATKYDSLAEMLSQLVLLSSESGDRVIRQGESCIPSSHDPSIPKVLNSPMCLLLVGRWTLSQQACH